MIHRGRFTNVDLFTNQKNDPTGYKIAVRPFHGSYRPKVEKHAPHISLSYDP